MSNVSFVETIRQRYSSGRDRLFILHGNTSDLFLHRPEGEDDGKTEILTLPDFLYRQFTIDGDITSKIWAHFSLGFGIRWINSEASGLTKIEKALTNEEKLLLISQRPLDILRAIERASMQGVTRVRSRAKLPLRIVITEGHLIVPDAQISFMRPEDRELLVLLKRFATEPAYDPSDTLIIIVTDTLSGVHRELRDVAVTIEIPRPSETDIQKYLEGAMQRNGISADTTDDTKLASLAMGLTNRQVENIVAECKRGGQTLGLDTLRKRRKELIKRDFGDWLELFEPQWTLDNVGGSPEAVAELREIAKELKTMSRRLPSGIILVGQNGIGKTFLAKALLGTAGITGVSLRPFKDSLLGASERNWEKIATALKSANQIGVLVDEADAQMGQRSGPNVHEVSRALFASQMELMGDPAYRGRIFWILMTCRPDKLAPDVKRPGRAERVIPLFPITSMEEAEAIIKAQVTLLAYKEGYAFAPTLIQELKDAELDNTHLMVKFVYKTGAQVEKLLRRAGRLAGSAPIDVLAIKQVLELEAQARAEPEAHVLQRCLGINEAIETENTDLIPFSYRGWLTEKDGVGNLKRTIEELRARVDYV